MNSIKRYQPYMVTISLMTLTLLCLQFLVEVPPVEKAGIRIHLPAQVGNWSGHELRYCHRPGCLGELSRDNLSQDNLCPKCGDPSFPMSIAEKDLTPADTLFFKKRYTRNGEDNLFVSIVVSDQDSRSIHRPQVCLVGQGFRILHSHRVDVTLKDRAPLSMMLLDIATAYQPGTPGNPAWNGVFAYWFVAQGRETPYNMQRMFWIFWDRLFHGVEHRWAYIAIMGGGRSVESQSANICEFAADFYPLITL